ncbi:MAG: cysteine--tRNA ligase [Candidatus Gracilibacteria bacterium]|nr:cysteine--tRNA ligase [Candidatus Gracilibacteria bacterium]MDD5179325.1 cysteine--tRNA ligase [Candidatus Gracilibacteria bacterium]
MSNIRLYNTFTRSKENLSPIEEGVARIYSCGPTVYASPHIGNFRAFLFADILRRSLEFFGLKVIHVMNVTDVGHLVGDSNAGEDKLEKGAKITGKTVWEVARGYEDEFKRDLLELNIEKATYFPRATEHIVEQLEMIKTLTAKGFTYETSDGIYYDVSKFADYGKLSGQSLEDKIAGARVEVKDEKRNQADFALWKFCVGENANHTMRWDFSGKDVSSEAHLSEEENKEKKIGFPGWHIECSAMGMKYLGETFDIHTGGVDHIPVHHENEIAQSEAATGKKFVNIWMHNEFLAVDGGKMSKSLGNLYTLEDLKKKGFEPLSFRYLTLLTHYRKKLDFTWEALKAATSALQNLREIYQTLPDAEIPLASAVKEFGEALADDLNTAKALAVAWEIAKNENITPGMKKATLAKFDEVLGLELDKAAEAVELNESQKKLLVERETARKNKEWQKSDALRDELAQLGIEVEDTSEGQIVKRKL